MTERTQEQLLEYKALLMRSYDDISNNVEPTEFINHELALGKRLDDIKAGIEDNRVWIMETMKMKKT
jgi:hypothetical protein